MLLSGNFKFAGVEKRQPNGKDPYYVLGLYQGMDSMQLYIDAELYGKLSSVEPFTDVKVTVDYQRGAKTPLRYRDIVF